MLFVYPSACMNEGDLILIFAGEELIAHASFTFEACDVTSLRAVCSSLLRVVNALAKVNAAFLSVIHCLILISEQLRKVCYFVFAFFRVRSF